MVLRKEVRSLGADERKAFIDALLQLKKAGRYDEYVHWHHAVMIPTVYTTEPANPDYRNGAHRGPSFLPWHREMLLQVEADLQRINSSITIPFWDWTLDSALGDSTLSPIWGPDLMGGNGVEADGWRVATGPFAYAGGSWPIPMAHDGPALLRRFGLDVPNLPTADDLALAMNEAFYDTPPFSSSPFNTGFRNRLEGWITQRGDSRVKYPGSQLHNRVHLWIGGSMEPMTSPNDPIFFLHHCFIDKVWHVWQLKQAKDWQDSGYPGQAPQFNPISGGPDGHNLNDVLKPRTHKIGDVLDIAALGYDYEDTPNAGRLLALTDALRSRTPFAKRRSPFWADF